MATWNFSDVSTMIASAGFQVRRNARDVLHQNGIRKIIETDQFDVAANELGDADVDLLICDSELKSGSSLDLVHNIRHQITGTNPFVVVMSLVDPKQKSTVMGVVNAGTDSLVTKPFWGHELSDRLWTVARRNRKFSVSHDYVGPTRRRSEGQPERDAVEMAVPNPVKEIAHGTSRDDLKAEVAAAAVLLSSLKVRRDALYVAQLIRGIVARLRADETNGAISSRRDKVMEALDDIARRTPDDTSARVETRALLAQALRRLTAELPKTDPKVVAALVRLADAVELAFEEPAAE